MALFDWNFGANPYSALLRRDDEAWPNNPAWSNLLQRVSAPAMPSAPNPFLMADQGGTPSAMGPAVNPQSPLMALLQAPETPNIAPLASRTTLPNPMGGQPAAAGGGAFDLDSDAWQKILMGLAMLDASRPQVNPPPLAQILSPFVAGRGARMSEKRKADLMQRELALQEDAYRRLIAGGPEPGWGPLGGDPSAMPGGLFAPAAQGQPAAYPSTGDAQLSAGGGVPNALEQFLSLAKNYESEGRNIPQQVVPAGGGYNPSVGRVTGPSTASGYYQITDTTWKNFAPRAGVDVRLYPTAMSAPEAVQKQVAATIATTDGVQHWTDYNKPLRAAVKNAGLPVAGPIGGNAPTMQLAQYSPQGGAGGYADTVLPSDRGQTGGLPTQMAQANTGVPPQQQQAQSALSQMPPPPPSPDSFPGIATQRFYAQRNIQYWGNVMKLAPFLGDAGKGYMELAKTNMDIAKGFLTEEQKKRVDAAWGPTIKAAEKEAELRARRLYEPQLEGDIIRERERARLEAYPEFKSIDTAAAIEQAWGTPTDLMKEVRLLPPEQRSNAIANAIRDNRPVSVREAEAARNDPTLGEEMLKQKRAGAMAITTQPGFEAVRQQALFESDKPVVIEAQKRALAAQATLPLLDEMIRLAPITPEGWAGPASAQLAAIASGMGLPVSAGMSNAELMRSMTQRFVPIVREPGATSEKELAMYLQAAPGLWQSAAGRIKVAEMTKALARHQVKLAEVYRNNQGSPELYAKIAEVASEPLFSEDQRTALESEIAKLNNQPAAAAFGRPAIPAPTSKREYDKLAPGTQFRDPDGNVRIKP